MAPAAVALPLIGKGVAAGVASFGASKVLGKMFGDDEDETPTPAAPAPAPYGQQYAGPNPYQQGSPAGQMSPAGLQQPAAAGMAGAGGAMITAASPVSAPATGTPGTETREQEDGFLESAGKVLLAAGAGGIAGFALKNKEAQEDGLEGGAKFAEIAKGVLAGAGSGAFTKMGYDAIQEEGGGLKAGLNGGIAGMLASTLKDGGPGLGASFATAFGAGAVSNLAHDKLEEHGSSKLADAVAGGGVATGLGYIGLGDGKAAGLLGLGGAGVGTALGALGDSGGMSGMVTEDGPLDKLKDLIGNDAAPQKNSEQQLD
ncbi:MULTISPECIES: hypothetical protein [Nocardiaceae]|uniref:hypothetical protein n=1 Tax=Nocardiaceae TaxID=85025 RepID=UPI00070FAD12|nr:MULTISPECIES: hypothetical protein [Rhodococcus]KQU35742.1 hypothetical protein ASH04_24015 [Rhodococcus sp. Leaf233]MBP2527426.1 hypothetical protein [Rhodococcus sp. PvP104]WQH31352.1 hypothetical protein U2G91_26465 [Rhodococcus fascians]